MNLEFYVQASFPSHGERHRRVLGHKGLRKSVPAGILERVFGFKAETRLSDSSGDAHRDVAVVSVKAVLVLKTLLRAGG